jgi:tRNA A-37 threonylcarbamoyl transferase component Bud32
MIQLDHHAYLAMREGAEVIEDDYYGDKVLRLPDGSYLKLFRRKRLLSSAAWYPYAQRFADNAEALSNLGIPVPKIIAVMRIDSIRRDAVHYEPLAGAPLRALMRNGLGDDTERQLKAKFNEFVVRLHNAGVYFRSLHLGNVILSPDGRMGLIDFSDLRIFRSSLPNYLRRRNIRRIEGIEEEKHWIDRSIVLGKR